MEKIPTGTRVKVSRSTSVLYNQKGVVVPQHDENVLWPCYVRLDNDPKVYGFLLGELEIEE